MSPTTPTIVIHGVALARRTEHQPLAHRILIRPVAVRKRLVDHDRGRRTFGDVARVGKTPVHQPHLHRLEESGRHGVAGRFDLLGRRKGRTIFQRERAGIRRVAQKQIADDGRALDARQRAHPFEQLGVELHELRRLREPRPRHVDPHREDVVRAESRVHAAQRAKRPQQQAGAGEQHDGERALDHEQRRPGARGGARSGQAASALAQRVLQVDARQLQRRPQTKSERRTPLSRRAANASTDASRPISSDARQIGRRQPHQRAHAGVSRRDAGRARDNRERRSFHQQLARSSAPRPAPIAERTTISRPRASARARNSPATLTQAISSTNPTAPSST